MSDYVIPQFNVHTTAYEPCEDSVDEKIGAANPQMSEFIEGRGIEMAQLYLSEDKKRALTIYRYSADVHLPFHFGWDDAVYVIAGRCTGRLDNGETIVLEEGDAAYFKEGQFVDFQVEAGFHYLGTQVWG